MFGQDRMCLKVQPVKASLSILSNVSWSVNRET